MLWRNSGILCYRLVQQFQKPACEGFASRHIATSTILHQQTKSAESKGLPSAKRPTNWVVKEINEQIGQESHGRLFAVIHMGGRQYKITPEDLIQLNTNSYFPDIGERLRLEKVLCVGSQDFTLLGRPLLDNVKVEATVIEKTLSHPKIWYKYMRRKNVRKTRLIQEFLTVLRINSIEITDNISADEVSAD